MATLCVCVCVVYTFALEIPLRYKTRGRWGEEEVLLGWRSPEPRRVIRPVGYTCGCPQRCSGRRGDGQPFKPLPVSQITSQMSVTALWGIVWWKSQLLKRLMRFDFRLYADFSPVRPDQRRPQLYLCASETRLIDASAWPSPNN